MPCTSITCSLTCNTSGARWHYGSGTESSIGSYARKVCGLQHRREDKSFFAIITTAIAQMILAGRDVGELLSALAPAAGIKGFEWHSRQTSAEGGGPRQLP